eukprot:scaffold170607_cov39-Attheya_sp.AAC.1
MNRCGLTREAIHGICEERYGDTDDLDLVNKDTIRGLVSSLRKRKEIVVPVPNPNHVMARSGAVHIPSNTENKLLVFHHWINICADRGESTASGLFQAADLKEYTIHLHNSSDGGVKDSRKLVAKPSKFSNDTLFPSWQRKLS